ncbi:MAG: hypothetical protein KGJ90_04725 [Patescibacteria group bacterium]|nr:hypothetical protein [Patescibacteria group bacterium]
MDIGNDVRAKKEDGDTRVLVQTQADLREANILLESLAFLEDNFEWGQFKRILIVPSVEKVEKTLDELNAQVGSDAKEGKSNASIMSQIIYFQAFKDVLNTLTDIPKLRKKYSDEISRLKGRLKELEKKHAKEEN